MGLECHRGDRHVHVLHALPGAVGLQREAHGEQSPGDFLVSKPAGGAVDAALRPAAARFVVHSGIYLHIHSLFTKPRADVSQAPSGRSGGAGVMRRGWWPNAPLVIVSAAILYFIGAGRVSRWDRDEAWYAQTSKQMVESGDWVVPRFLDSPRYAKPILIYWCQAASMKLFGPTALAARIPSALAMLGTITLLAVVLKRAVRGQRANLTILIFASSAIVIASAKMCLTDSI